MTCLWLIIRLFRDFTIRIKNERTSKLNFQDDFENAHLYDDDKFKEKLDFSRLQFQC